MLRIIVESSEDFNEETQEFITTKEAVVLDLEHSLLSLSKWESKYEKAFLSKGEKTTEELFDYLNFMIVTPDVGPEIFSRCSQKNLDDIQRYIESAQSATTFGNMPERKGSNEIITAELIYYWMFTFGIPFQCENWHLNKLFALIKIFNVKNSKPKKISRSELAQRNAEENARRKAQLNTAG